MKNEHRWVTGWMLIIAGVAVLYFAHFAPEIMLPEHVVRAADVGAVAALAFGSYLVAKTVVKKISG
jgi:hypothetical protein